jgi:hypothetical protein
MWCLFELQRVFIKTQLKRVTIKSELKRVTSRNQLKRVYNRNQLKRVYNSDRDNKRQREVPLLPTDGEQDLHQYDDREDYSRYFHRSRRLGNIATQDGDDQTINGNKFTWATSRSATSTLTRTSLRSSPRISSTFLPSTRFERHY